MIHIAGRRRKVPDAAASRPVRVGLLSPCGWGNLGDAAIQEAAIRHLRRLRPGAEIVAFTLNPSDTEERHGVPAFPLAPVRASGQLPGRRAQADEGLTIRVAERIATRLHDVRYLGRAWRAGTDGLRTLRAEGRHVARMFRHVRRLDLLVVSGGGQLDDLWGGPWNHPRWLYMWAKLAALAGTRFVVLGVGVGSLTHRLSRRFVRGTLSAASYRSYRDDRSRQLAVSLGVGRGDAVTADLAFGLDPSRTLRGARANVGGSSARLVGVSPMAYMDPRAWPVKDAATYRDYLSRLAGLCLRLLEEPETSIRFFTTARADRRVVQDLLEELEGRTGRLAGESLSVTPAGSVDELFAFLAETDVIVASRLHGVLLAHLAGRPVLALSYEDKVDRHMASLGQDEFVLPIDSFSPDHGAETLRTLEFLASDVRRSLERQLPELGERVARDFERALSGIPGEGGAK